MAYFVGLSLLLVLGLGQDLVSGQSNLAWWQQSVVYQVYPRSFKDSDGDGVGDLKGITEQVDYFKSLGVEAIWVSPFFKSPMADFGYDISDFRDVDPIFGTIEDFRNMSKVFRDNGLKLILDMVPNHSSDQHEWFIKSVNREDSYTDYYVWRNASGTDLDGNPIPPNNWVSVFGGSMWQWNDVRKQFYLHQFVKEQPDLNYENNAVRYEMLAVFQFWLDNGADGFRMDAVPFLYEDQRFLNEMEDPNRLPEARPDEWRYWLHPYSYNLTGVFEFLADARLLLDVYSVTDGRVRCMMVETGVPDEYVMNYYNYNNRPIAHFPFNFKLLKVNATAMRASEILNLVDFWASNKPANEWATSLIGNHDQKRAATRWTEAGVDGANMINLLLQGTAVTYYGEEIGMTDTFLSWEDTQDPAACNTDPERYEFFSRDPARTPMQWDDTINAGFSSNINETTWLPVNPNYETLNVRVQEEASESHLHVYRNLTDLRRTDAWQLGTYESGTTSFDSVLAFKRAVSGGGSFLVLVSFADTEEIVNVQTFSGKTEATVKIRSVGATVPPSGTIIPTNAIPLGPRNSVVLELDPLNYLS